MGLLNKLFGSKKENPQKKAAPVSPKETKTLNDPVEINYMAKEAEVAGDFDKAIVLYEINVENEFEGNGPYDRLAILYRKKEMIEDEIRVLEKGISVFKSLKNSGSPRADLDPKIEKFEDRLEKARELLAK